MKEVDTDFKFMNKNINYCGTYERQAFFTKWIPLQTFFPGINKGCYLHDCRYNILFTDEDQRRQLLKILFLKFRIDLLFFIEMLRFSLKNTKNPVKIISRIMIAVIFFLIVVFATPYYAYLFAKRQEK